MNFEHVCPRCRRVCFSLKEVVGHPCRDIAAAIDAEIALVNERKGLNVLNWTEIGQALRESALDAHDGRLIPVEVAYSFLLDNPECFLLGDQDEWPEDMPQEPNIELIAAYYRVGEEETP